MIRLASLVLLVLGAIGLSGCSSIRPDSQAADFELTNQHGQPVALTDLRGRSVALTFLYTRCPDTCPLYLGQLRAATTAMQEAGATPPVVVVVTVDPDRDTVERLRAFSLAWPSDWLFLTGTYPEVAVVWKRYGITAVKQPLPHSSHVHDGYFVAHGSKVVLIDEWGHVASELRGAWSVGELVVLANGAPGSVTTTAIAWRGALAELIRRCGELAAARPALFLATVVALFAPGVLLPLWLLRTLLGARRPASRC
ncbi:MAG: SCO family protein [Chloroflexi bacterium]|nr:SCO family protein [Chloroflexota bacterium]